MPQTKTANKPLSKTATNSLRGALEKRREQLLSLFQHDLKVGQTTNADSADDVVDRANHAYNRELMLSLSGTEREQLKEVEDALIRLEEGKAGTCGVCETPIPLPRLNAVPWTRYCVTCQERSEQGLLELD